MIPSHLRSSAAAFGQPQQAQLRAASQVQQSPAELPPFEVDVSPEPQRETDLQSGSCEMDDVSPEPLSAMSASPELLPVAELQPACFEVFGYVQVKSCEKTVLDRARRLLHTHGWPGVNDQPSREYITELLGLRRTQSANGVKVRVAAK